jgi:APA family basic amino acid/polyamine antiporter
MTNFHVSAGRVAPQSWLLALIPVMFTYAGWNAAGYIAEELRDPGRTVPRAFAIGTAAVIAIYLALNLLYIYVLPVESLGRVQGSVLDVIADRLLGARAGNIMGVVSVISLAASISAMTFAGPRVYYAMARDGLFFPAAAHVHPRYRTPAVSIVAQAVWSGLLVLSGSAETLTRYTGFAIVLFSGVAVAALFVLRRREPSAPRPFRATGYPVAPAVFMAASLAIVVNAVYRDPGPAGAGLLVIAAGVPLYLWLTRRRAVS